MASCPRTAPLSTSWRSAYVKGRAACPWTACGRYRRAPLAAAAALAVPRPSHVTPGPRHMRAGAVRWLHAGDGLPCRALQNIKFIGPSAYAMNALGDKIHSKELAIKAGVRTVPGFVGDVPTPE